VQAVWGKEKGAGGRRSRWGPPPGGLFIYFLCFIRA